MQIIPATPQARAEYRGVYPLYGYVHVDAQGYNGRLLCPVEDLRKSWGKDDPQWEVLAPDGWIFGADGTHSLLGFTQRDLLDRICTLEPDPETAA